MGWRELNSGPAPSLQLRLEERADVSSLSGQCRRGGETSLGGHTASSRGDGPNHFGIDSHDLGCKIGWPSCHLMTFDLLGTMMVETPIRGSFEPNVDRGSSATPSHVG